MIVMFDLKSISKAKFLVKWTLWLNDDSAFIRLTTYLQDPKFCNLHVTNFTKLSFANLVNLIQLFKYLEINLEVVNRRHNMVSGNLANESIIDCFIPGQTFDTQSPQNCVPFSSIE